MKNKYIFLMVTMFVIAISGIIFVNREGTKREQSTEGKLQVVTSFYPVYIGALNITDQVEGITLTNLAKPTTGCLHDYQLSTEDMVRLGEADIFLINGGGMESFMEEVAGQYPKLPIIETGSAYLAEANKNTHIWLCLDGYASQMEVMEKALSEIDPDNRYAYRENLGIYLEELDRLKIKAEELSKKIGGIKVILFHEGFEYLTDMLELEAVAVLDMDEDTGLNAGELSDLAELAKKEGAVYLLCDSGSGKTAADTIAGEINGEVIVLDPLTSGASEKTAYLTAMENNLNILGNSMTAYQEENNEQGA